MGRKLLDQVRDQIRLRHYSMRTEKSYVDWIKRFIIFNGKRHPLEMDAPEGVDELLNSLTQGTNADIVERQLDGNDTGSDLSDLPQLANKRVTRNNANGNPSRKRLTLN